MQRLVLLSFRFPPVSVHAGLRSSVSLPDTACFSSCNCPECAFATMVQHQLFLFSRLLLDRHFCMRLVILTSVHRDRADHGLASFHYPDVFPAHWNRGANEYL